jgi:hypothetical protein
MDYATIAQSSAALLAAAGIPVTVSRRGMVVVKTSGVFVKSDATNVKGDPISGISMMSTTQKTVLLPGNLKSKPQVGDDLACKLGSYHVIEVSEVNPGGTVLLYKLVMT